METLLLTIYLIVAAFMFIRHGSTYAVHMDLNTVSSIGEYIPPGYRWRIWYALTVSAALWPLALLIAKRVSGSGEGRYSNAIRFTVLGMLLGGGWGG